MFFILYLKNYHISKEFHAIQKYRMPFVLINAVVFNWEHLDFIGMKLAVLVRPRQAAAIVTNPRIRRILLFDSSHRTHIISVTI